MKNCNVPEKSLPYVIVRGGTYEEIEEGVNSLIERGYLPHGSLSETDDTVAQPMINLSAVSQLATKRSL